MENDRPIDVKQRQMFRSLLVAHKSSLLIYSKFSASTELARKMRAEFAKVFVANDLNEALSMVSGHRSLNNDIDLIVADADVASIKLVELANARPLNPATSKLPIISTLMLLDRHNEEEIRDELTKVGGCNAIVMAPYTSYKVMEAILDCLRRRRLVEYSYRNLKEHHEKDYPHLAVFEDVQDIDSMLVKKPNTSSVFETSMTQPSMHTSKSMKTNSMVQSSASNAVTEFVDDDSSVDSALVCDDCDEYSNCSSLLPKYVNEDRASRGAILHHVNADSDGESALVSPAKGKPPAGVLAEIDNRKKVDEAILEELNISVKQSDSFIADDTSVVVDAYEKEQEILRKQHAAAALAMQRSRKHENVNIEKHPDIEDVFDESKRVKWGFGESIMTRQQKLLCEAEMRPFIDRQLPNLRRRQILTVAGLDRNMTNGCWKMINGGSAIVHGRGMGSIQKNDCSSILDFSPALEAMMGSIVSNDKSADSKTFQDNSFVVLRRQESTMSPSTGGHSKEQSLSCSGSGTRIHAPNIANMNKAKRRGKRLLNNVALKTPVEASFCRLIELEMGNLHMPAQEKELLRQGKSAEMARDYKMALENYKKSAKTTKKPHISWFFTAICQYAQNKFLDALKTFGNVIAQGVVGVLPHKHNNIISLPPTDYELYAAQYNRGLIYFRLGDDSRGLADLQVALSLNPKSLLVKEKIALALRRMNRFEEAMKITSEISQAKEEDKAKKLEKLSMEKQKELLERTDSITSVCSQGGDDGSSTMCSDRRDDVQDDENSLVDSIASVSLPIVDSNSPMSVSTTPKPLSASDSKKRLSLNNSSTVSTAVVSAMPSRAEKVTIQGTLCNSMSDRIAYLRKHGRTQGDKESLGGAIKAVSLDAFKVTNGFKKNLAESIFVRPSSVQEALAYPPALRSYVHLEVIMTSLRLVPMLQTAPPEIVRELAAVAEFRAYTGKAEILKQDYPASCVGILLRGSIEIRMEMNQAALAASFQSPNNLILSELGPNSAFGHIDMLFANPYKTKSFLGMDELDENDMERHSSEIKEDCTDSLVPDGLSKEKNYDISLQGVSVPDSGTPSKKGDMDSQSPGSPTGFIYDAPLKEESGPGARNHVEMMRKAAELFNATKTSSAASIMSGGTAHTANDISESIGGCRPQIFTTASVVNTSEIIYIKPYDFERLLVPTVRNELFTRLETIRASRIFSNWSHRSHIQLARMGTMHYYRAGEIIIDQGDTPKFLYIISKGMCKAYKKPNKLDIMNKNLTILLEKAKDHDMKYHFHHRLRHTLVPASVSNVVPHEKGTGGHTTELEYERYKLEIEIKKLELSIKQLTEGLENPVSEVSSIGDEEGDENEELDEISVLQWPMLFGESCVVSPDTGISAGRIVADTPCEIFSIHKLQLQTFRITDAFVAEVKNHAVVYPNDELLVGSVRKKKDWKKYKDEFLKELQVRSTRYRATVAKNTSGSKDRGGHENPFII